MMLQKRGQGALEFLMTYGWAIIALLITIAALSYFGVINTSGLIPESCTFFPGLACTDFTMSNDGKTVTLEVRNGLGNSLQVNDIELSICPSCTVNVNPNPIQDGAKATITIENTVSIAPPGTRLKSDIEVNYQIADIGINHVRTGSLTTRVPDEQTTTSSTSTTSTSTSTSISTSTVTTVYATFAPTADTFISSSSPTSSFSTSIVFGIRNSNTGGAIFVTLMQFDITSIPDTATINSVNLQLNNYDSSVFTPGSHGSFHKLTTPGIIINSATWNTKDGTNSWQGGSIFSSADYEPTAIYTYIYPTTLNLKFNTTGGTLVSYMQDNLASNIITMAVLDIGTPDDTQHYVYSVNEGTVARRPKLFITYNP